VRGEVLGVVLDPSEQRGAARVEPRQADEVQAFRGGDSAMVDDLAVGVEDRRVDPNPARPLSSMPLRLARRLLEPIKVSRSFNRRPIRESTLFSMSPVACRTLKSSRPRIRAGSAVCREPRDRWTRRRGSAASSAAI
jgi:hypothetical protein